MRRAVLAMVASVLSLAQAAVAQVTPSAIPAQSQPATLPTTIVYSDKGPSGMSDLPMGVHRIPNSNVVISGHQKGGGMGILFGTVGMLVQSTANAQAGTDRVRDLQDDLRFDVTAKATELTSSILADDKYKQLFTLSPAASSSNPLTVVPYVVITFENETDVRPYIVLKTKFSSGTPGDSPKTIKYFCCEGAPLPLSGDTGLAENNGQRLKALLTSELDTAIHVMLLDRSKPYVRDDQGKVLVKGFLPFVGKSMKFRGYDLGRYNEDSLIDFRSGLLVFGGVNIVEPAALEITPAVLKK